MKSGVQIQRQGKVKDVSASTSAAGWPAEEIETTVALIQALIPLGLHAVGEALAAEVVGLAGDRYRRTGGRPGVVRWGQQPGSVYLADQKLPIPVPRVRDQAANREVPLATYERLQQPRAADAPLPPGLEDDCHRHHGQAVGRAQRLALERELLRHDLRLLQPRLELVRGLRPVAGAELHRPVDRGEQLVGVLALADARGVDQRIRIAAVVTVVKRQVSKKSGNEYARLTLEDFHGTAEALARKLTGFAGSDVVAYGTEAGIFQQAGWSTVVIGPGDIAQAHTVNEFIRVAELEKCLAFLARLADWAEA